MEVENHHGLNATSTNTRAQNMLRHVEREKIPMMTGTTETHQKSVRFVHT